MINSAASVPGSARDAALMELCRGYWTPVYAFICLEGYSKETAQDLTQDFFVHLLEHSLLQSAAPERGRFRNYLLVSLKNFLANQWHRENTQKRGGQHNFVSFDPHELDASYALYSSRAESPEAAFDRQYALTVIDRAIKNLLDSMTRDGKEAQFRMLQPYLADEAGTAPYAQLAGQLGTTEGALRVTLHRLRRRCRDFIRAEVAHLVTTPSEVESELQYLLRALSA